MIKQIFKLTWANLVYRPLSITLTTATLAAAVALISLILQFSSHTENRLEKDLAGVDLVVGAKGSPLQLILSSLLHIDIPTGNIPLAEAQSLMQDHQVQKAVPLALGDSFRSYRIIGTTHAFLSLYQAKLASGDTWNWPQQVVIGARVHQTLGMGLGQQFVGAHGLSTSGANLAEHAHAPYTVVGILEPTNSILDRLIITSIDSVWLAHGDDLKDEHDHSSHDDHGDHDNHRHHDHEEHEEHQYHHAEEDKNESLINLMTSNPADREITALLIKYKTPIAAVRLPREINKKPGLQAAAPAIEITRLFSLSSGMTGAAKAVAILLTLIGGLSIFSAVSTASAAGLYDVALMRAMGASPEFVLLQRIFEGVLIASTSGAIGIAAAHLTIQIAYQIYTPIAVFGLNGGQFFQSEAVLFIGTVIVGALAALWPALTCYRIAPSILLKRGR